MKKRIVIKLSGSIFDPERPALIEKFAVFLVKISKVCQPIVIARRQNSPPLHRALQEIQRLTFSATRAAVPFVLDPDAVHLQLPQDRSRRHAAFRAEWLEDARMPFCQARIPKVWH